MKKSYIFQYKYNPKLIIFCKFFSIARFHELIRILIDLSIKITRPKKFDINK